MSVVLLLLEPVPLAAPLPVVDPEPLVPVVVVAAALAPADLFALA